MPDPTSLLEIGARLAVTRKALGLTQAEMDRMMGSTYTDGQTCNTYETGRQRFSETDGLSDPHQSPSNLLNTNDNFFGVREPPTLEMENAAPRFFSPGAR